MQIQTFNVSSSEAHEYQVKSYQDELQKLQTSSDMLNSTADMGDNGNSSKQPLLINTSAFNSEELSNYISISEEIERQRRELRRHSMPARSLHATMTREEIFECSTLDDDNFLTALEYQNSYVPRITDLDLSQSIENIMKYFDEDIRVDSRSSCNATPTRLATVGKVAAVVANFRTKTASPPPTAELPHKYQPEIRANIQELRKKYEVNSEVCQQQQQSKQPSPAPKSAACAALTPPQPQERPAKPTRQSAPAERPLPTSTPLHEEQQKPPLSRQQPFEPLQKHQNISAYHSDLLKPASPQPVSKRQKSPKLSRKSKVKQMAQMFNAKISQFMRRDSDGQRYSPLENEFSPEAKPAPKPRSNKPPTYRTGGGVPSPVPSPRFRRKPMQHVQPLQKQQQHASNSCFVAEEVFGQLSVKDKALLYNKFIEDMSRQHPQFSIHAREVEANVQKQLARGEVVAEPQETVKHLAQELEAKFHNPKPRISPWAVKRLSELQADEKFKQFQFALPPSMPPLTTAQRGNDEADADEDQDEGQMHVSSLTVVLKPSPDGKKGTSGTLPRPRPVPRPLPRKQREVRFLNAMRNIECSHKRNNDSIRSSVHFDAYAPPKKIRRTRSERLAPKMVFQNTHMERLFYNWLMEKNGVSFDITAVDNREEIIEIALEPAEECHNTPEDTNRKSAVEKLLHEAVTKLGDVEAKKQQKEAANAKTVDKALTIINETRVNKQTVQKAVIEVELPMEMQRNSSQVKSPAEAARKTKRHAPPVPTNTAEPQENADSTVIVSSTASSNKPSDVESESGPSSLPKPPENELQKSHDHNSAALSEHQLRVQASLQRLNIPDWFRQYNQNATRSPDGNTAGYKPGNFTRKRTTESGRWAGLNSKTTSLSSLGSQRSDRSPLLLSPSAHSHHGGQGAMATHQQASGTGAYGTGGAGTFSRWSTSHLNSSQTSPSVSQRGPFTRGGPVNSSFMSVASGQSGVIRNSFRQPYLGWRSQEKLSQRTPHERLASSLLAQQQRTSPTQRNAPGAPNGGSDKLLPVTPEIQTSIKEVTSAIVHYVNDQTAQQRSRSASPNSRKCWLESSFVGIRPLDSPQTPIIDSTATAFTATNLNSSSTSSHPPQQYNNYNYNYNYNYNNNNNSNSSATSSIHSNTLTTTTNTFGQPVAAAAGGSGGGGGIGGAGITTAITTNPHVLRMNGLSIVGGAPERSLSTASLEDVLASLLGLPSTSAGGAGTGAGTSSTSDPYARPTTGDSASQSLFSFRHMPPQPQQQQPTSQQQQQQQLQVSQQAADQRLRRRSEGDKPTQSQQAQSHADELPSQQQLQQQQQLHQQQPTPQSAHNAKYNSTPNTATAAGATDAAANAAGAGALPPRRVSLGDSSESNNKTTSELQIKCRNTKCDRSATPADAKKYYKSCHNCTHLYCSRECRRAHWEKHRKACLHSRASNLCRQVLATCKDDVDSQRHLSLLARKGFLSQGRGVVRVLFRSAEAAESFIKHGFQCMGEASYVRWPDLMPAEMGLELYSELLKLSTEYKPDSKMLIYVAICVVSEAPGMGQAPVRWERQLVSRCAKLKLCKSILAELEQQQQALQHQQQQQQQPHSQTQSQTQSQSQAQPLAVVNVPEPTTEILILTFNPSLRASAAQGELILSNILDILSRRGVLLRKHYPEIYQRLQSYTDGQTDKFNPVTLHPRDSQTGRSFVCIIMPVQSSDSDVIKLPSASDGGNRVTTIDVGSPAALAQLDDDELLMRSTS